MKCAEGKEAAWEASMHQLDATYQGYRENRKVERILSVWNSLSLREMLAFDTAEINNFLKMHSACVDNIRYNAGKNPPEKASLRKRSRVTHSFRRERKSKKKRKRQRKKKKTKKKKKQAQIWKSSKKVSKWKSNASSHEVWIWPEGRSYAVSAGWNFWREEEESSESFAVPREAGCPGLLAANIRPIRILLALFASQVFYSSCQKKSVLEL